MVGKTKKASRVEEMKEGTVYLHLTPRCDYIPSILPACLKVETYLRMKEIPYEPIEGDTLGVAIDGQLPYCKINGKEISNFGNIICEIAKILNQETPDLDKEAIIDNGAQRAFEGLIEGSLGWVLIYMRATQANQLPPTDVFQGRFLQIFRPFANKFVTNKLKTKADYQGIGRQNVEDVVATGKQDLRAISAYLGDKLFLGGERPNKLDATAFAHLSQFWFIPTDNELKTFIKDECPNLVEYLNRIKSQYWADWEEKCRKPTPSRRSKSKEDSSNAVIEQQENQQSAAPAVNGTTEKDPAATKEETPTQQEPPNVEVVKTATPEEKHEKVENGIAEEKTPATTPNGGAPA